MEMENVGVFGYHENKNKKKISSYRWTAKRSPSCLPFFLGISLFTNSVVFYIK